MCLTCTVGEVSKRDKQRGITFEDLDRFVKILKCDLKGSKLRTIFVERPISNYNLDYRGYRILMERWFYVTPKLTNREIDFQISLVKKEYMDIYKTILSFQKAIKL